MPPRHGAQILHRLIPANNSLSPTAQMRRIYSKCPMQSDPTRVATRLAQRPSTAVPPIGSLAAPNSANFGQPQARGIQTLFNGLQHQFDIGGPQRDFL